MIGGYVARRTWLHGIPAGIKLVAIVGSSLALLAIDDYRVLLGVLVLVALLYANFGRDGWARLLALRPLLPLLAIVGALQGYSAGWEAGTAVVIRLVAMVLLADLVTMSTTMSALMGAIEPPLRALGPRFVNAKKVSLAVALVLRFVPVLMTRWQARREAWQARSNRRVPLRLVAAFVAETLQLADQVAEALDARGFDAASPRRSN